VLGGLETTANVASKAVAQPVALGASYINRLFGGSEDEAAQVQQNVNETLTYQPRTEGGQAGAELATGTIDAFNQGATLGFADELEGAISPKQYKVARNAARLRNKRFKEDSPIIATTADFAGGAAAPLLTIGNSTRLARLAKDSPKAAAAITGAGVGIVDGIISGAGFSEAQVDTLEFMHDVGLGAALGGSFGVIGSGVGMLLTDLSKSPMFNSNAGKIAIRDALKDADPEALQRQLDIFKVGSGTKVTLADLTELQTLVSRANSEIPLEQATRDRLVQRSTDVQNELVNQVDPKVNVGDTVAGRQLKDSDVTATESRVNTDNFTNNARLEANERAKPLYEEAYGGELNDDSLYKLITLEDSPTFKAAYAKGKANAQDLNIQGEVPRDVQILDETSKVLAAQINRAEVGQSKAALTKLKTSLDDLVYQSVPLLKEARELSKVGQVTKGNIADGNAAITANIDATDNFLRSFDYGSEQAQQRAIGAGRKINELISKRAEAGKRGVDGKIITDAEAKAYNKLISGTEDNEILTGLIGKEAAFARTTQFKEVPESTWQANLKQALPINFKDAAAIASIMALVTNPTLIGSSYAAARVGQATLARRSKKNLSRQIQNELYKMGLNEKRLKDIVTGEFSKVNPKALALIGTRLASGLGRTAINEVTPEAEQPTE